MGLQEIIDEIKKDSYGEYDGILSRARQEAALLKEERAAELSEIFKRKSDALENELKRLKLKLFAKAELESERENQHAENELIEGLLGEAYRDLAKTLRDDKKEYTAFLARLIRDSMKLAGGKSISVSLSKDDEPLFPAIKKAVKGELELLPASRITGGVICVSGQNYIDNSIENLFGQLKPDFLKMVSDEIRNRQ